MRRLPRPSGRGDHQQQRRVIGSLTGLLAAIVSLGCGGAAGARPATVAAPAMPAAAVSLRTDLSAIFDAPALARAVLAVQIDRLSDGATIFERNANLRVVPGSLLKILTALSAATTLGWDYRFTTTLEGSGVVVNGTLTGDLVVTGSGDPSIGAVDSGGRPLFEAWADALIAAGIRRIEGRILGDDNAFEEEPIGSGWAWDNLAAGYAAPSGALSYNENAAVVRIAPAPVAGAPPAIELRPAGHGLVPQPTVITADPGTPVSVVLLRTAGQPLLGIDGQVPAGGATVVRTASVDNPTRFFVEALREQLLIRGIAVSGPAADLDDIRDPPIGARWPIAQHTSEPLSGLIRYALKNSQNFYAEMLLKTTGRSTLQPGSAERGRRRALDLLAAWQIPSDSLVMRDGSGLSRYNYASAGLLMSLLHRAWRDETLRDPFVTALPIGGRDGTLSTRMRTPPLQGRVMAKTGTLDNVRALAGFAAASSGETVAFVMIANHFTAPAAEIDALMERALTRVIRP